MACGILVPRPGIEPASPELQGGFLTTGPPGKSPHWTSCCFFKNDFSLDLGALTHATAPPENAFCLSLYPGNLTHLWRPNLKRASFGMPFLIAPDKTSCRLAWVDMVLSTFVGITCCKYWFLWLFPHQAENFLRLETRSFLSPFSQCQTQGIECMNDHALMIIQRKLA